MKAWEMADYLTARHEPVPTPNFSRELCLLVRDLWRAWQHRKDNR